MDLPVAVIVLGTITGLTYGLLSAGLVIVYRSNGIINFAHGEIGAFGAAMFGLATTRWHVPYYVALPLALLAGGGTAAVAEVAVIRRLRNAPRLMSVVATLGVAQFLVVFALTINAQAGSGLVFPEPPGMPVFHVGALRVTPSYAGTLFMAPVVVVALAAFLRFSRIGIGLRGAAANPEAARLAGISTSRMSSLAWGLAGALSTFTAILVLPTIGLTTGAAFGPGLLLRALVGAVLARMTNLPGALAGGVALGVAEGLLLHFYPRGGAVEMALFLIIVIGLLLQSRRGSREAEQGSTWAAVEAWPPLPDAVARLPLVRMAGPALAILGLVALTGVGLVASNRTTITMASILALATVGFSVGIVTGLGGQLSLGQFAVAAVGATASYQVATRTGQNIVLSMVYAMGAAALVSSLLALPAVRLRGLLLTVTTLSFALVVPAWALRQPWALGEISVQPGRPIVFGMQLESDRSYYLLVIVGFALVALVARNIRRSGVGRLLVAVRDNEDNARAFGLHARLIKLQGFALAGAVAGMGGALYAHTFTSIESGTFPTSRSLDVVVMTVVGGIGVLWGPVLGAAFTLGIPAFLPLDTAGLAATRVGLLLVILYAPGGIAQIVAPLRAWAVGLLVRWSGGSPVDDGAGRGAATVAPMLRSPASIALPPVPGRDGPTIARLHPPPLLEATELTKRYGGVTAVDAVDLTVGRGEIVGLIGPNGAGKTTLFELLSGFTSPDAGHVRLDGAEVTQLAPERRAALGLIRSFQDAALFPTMTVTDTVELALERALPTSLVAGVIGLRGRDRRRRAVATELIDAMGLGGYRLTQVRQLSTGTRRIAEIACLIALQPRLLLLDEPSSGIAQRETEALGSLLAGLARDFGLTLVVIEHDIPLIMGLADRIVAMDAGRVIASGAPAIVRHDPVVVEAYLGTSAVAIGRSG